MGQQAAKISARRMSAAMGRLSSFETASLPRNSLRFCDLRVYRLAHRLSFIENRGPTPKSEIRKKAEWVSPILRFIGRTADPCLPALAHRIGSVHILPIAVLNGAPPADSMCRRRHPRVGAVVPLVLLDRFRVVERRADPLVKGGRGARANGLVTAWGLFLSAGWCRKCCNSTDSLCLRTIQPIG